MDTEDSDSVAKFVADLQALRRARGLDGFKALGRKMGLSHGAVHAALSQSQRLPSEYVLSRMIGFWDPDSVDRWMDRRRRLAQASADKDPEPVEPSTSPSVSTVPGRLAALVSFAAIAILAILGLIPIDAGGVDVWDFCSTTYGSRAGTPPAEGVADGGLWMCRLESGELVPADMSAACKEQHPAWTSAGRTFVVHETHSLTTWHCYTAQLSFAPRG